VRLGAMALAGIAVGWLLSLTLFPLVKSLWTPSWTIVSTAICVLMLAAIMYVQRQRTPSRLARAVMILGTNSILLYVIAFTERWRIVTLWQRILGDTMSSLEWWPVLEACLVLLTLWGIGYVLFRQRVLIRL